MGLFKWLKKKGEPKVGINPSIPYNIKDITLLILSDLHRGLSEEEKDILMQHRPIADAVITLGDIPVEGLKHIDMDFGVLGNHDSFGQLGDKNIHGNKVEVKGVSFVGIQGSHRYKAGPFVVYTHEESEQLDLPRADILISHDAKFREGVLDDAHCGLKGITKYLDEYKPFLHIHGHLHREYYKKYNDTFIVGVYKCVLLKIRNSEVFVEHLF